MEKLAENDFPYFYPRHLGIVVTAVTTISLTPVKPCQVKKIYSKASKITLPIWLYHHMTKATTINTPQTDNIIEMVKSVDILKPKKEELNKVLSSIKKGNAADIFDLTIEYFYSGDALLDYTHSIISAIFESGIMPDMIKEELLSPVFKNKGSILDIKNYRGITVLSVVEKIVESILKNSVRPKCDKQQ